MCCFGAILMCESTRKRDQEANCMKEALRVKGPECSKAAGARESERGRAEKKQSMWADLNEVVIHIPGDWPLQLAVYVMPRLSWPCIQNVTHVTTCDINVYRIHTTAAALCLEDNQCPAQSKLHHNSAGTARRGLGFGQVMKAE